MIMLIQLTIIKSELIDTENFKIYDSIGKYFIIALNVLFFL